MGRRRSSKGSCCVSNRRKNSCAGGVELISQELLCLLFGRSSLYSGRGFSLPSAMVGVAVVVGVGPGLGLAIARRFARENYTVAEIWVTNYRPLFLSSRSLILWIYFLGGIQGLGLAIILSRDFQSAVSLRTQWNFLTVTSSIPAPTDDLKFEETWRARFGIAEKLTKMVEDIMEMEKSGQVCTICIDCANSKSVKEAFEAVNSLEPVEALVVQLSSMKLVVCHLTIVKMLVTHLHFLGSPLQPNTTILLSNAHFEFDGPFGEWTNSVKVLTIMQFILERFLKFIFQWDFVFGLAISGICKLMNFLMNAHWVYSYFQYFDFWNSSFLRSLFFCLAGVEDNRVITVSVRYYAEVFWLCRCTMKICRFPGCLQSSQRSMQSYSSAR